MVKVDFIEILFVESMREYVYIHTGKEKVITKMTIGEMEELLGPGFIRVHRSFIVNAAKITAYTSEDVFIDKVAVPVGPNYRDSLRTVLGNWSNGMLLTS